VASVGGASLGVPHRDATLIEVTSEFHDTVIATAVLQATLSPHKHQVSETKSLHQDMPKPPIGGIVCIVLSLSLITTK